MLAGGKWIRWAMTLGVLGSLISWTGCGDSGNQGGGSSSTTNTQGGKDKPEKGSADAPKKGTGDSKTRRLVFIINVDDPFWDACNSGLQDGAKQFELGKAGMSVERYVNNGKVEGQIDALRQFAAQPDVVGIAISAIEADNAVLVDEMRKLQAKGVKMITVDGDVDRNQFRDARTYYIGTDNFTAGKVLGTATQALLKGRKLDKGAYVQFAGFTNNDNAKNRMDGVKSVLEGFEERDRMPDETDSLRARENVRNALTNHNDLVALIGIWAYNAPAIAEVAKERGARDKVSIATFDAQQGAIAAMGEGGIDVMCVQNPFDMGVQTVKLLKAMVEDDKAVTKEMFPRFGETDGDIYTTGLRIVVPDVESPVKADMFDPKVVEFMELPAFQNWLKKYNLTSS
jgi:ribose transport system substrate-binding protein